MGFDIWLQTFMKDLLKSLRIVTNGTFRLAVEPGKAEPVYLLGIPTIEAEKSNK